DHVAYTATAAAAIFGVSGDGRLISAKRQGAIDTELVWQNRSGALGGVLGTRSDYSQLRFSPDGTRLAFTRPDPQTGNRDVFWTDLATGSVTQLTRDASNDWFPAWSPDGKRMLFGSDRRDEKMNTYVKQAMDPASEEIPFPGDDPSDWSGDGKW